MLAVQSPAETTKEDDHPERGSKRQQNLPEPPKVEIFKTLVTKPEPRILEPSFDSGILAKQASKNHDRQGTQQSVRKQVLSSRFAAGDHRRQEDSSGKVRGRYPENGELQVPRCEQC